MIFRVTFKDPDSLHDAIKDAVKEDVAKLALDAEESEAVSEIRTQSTKELCQKWFEYSEYITVEIDTELKTCTVVSTK